MSTLRRTVVLVAEDDDADYKFLKCMLKEAPLAVLFRVSDGQQTIDYLKGAGAFSNRLEYPLPNIFILDLKLPKVSGFEILDWMAPQPGFGPMRIFILSGSDSKADRERAHRSGAHDYFVKPLSLAHIAALFSEPPMDLLKTQNHVRERERGETAPRRSC